MAAATIARLHHHHHHHHVPLLSKALPPLLLIPVSTSTTISPFFCQFQSQSRSQSRSQSQSYFYYSRAFSTTARRRYGFREEVRGLTREGWGTSDTRRRAFSGCATVHAKKYTKDHEWIELSEDGTQGTIGITTYAASALGDVVFIELPEIGQEVSAGDTIGAVESVKSASDILTPLSGTVIAANEALEGKPSIINKAPEGEGWIAMIEVKSGGEDGSGSGGKEGDKEKLMDEEEYRRFTEEV